MSLSRSYKEEHLRSNLSIRPSQSLSIPSLQSAWICSDCEGLTDLLVSLQSLPFLDLAINPSLSKSHLESALSIYPSQSLSTLSKQSSVAWELIDLLVSLQSVPPGYFFNYFLSPSTSHLEFNEYSQIFLDLSAELEHWTCALKSPK